MTPKETLQKAIDIWGKRAQLEMAQEESTELALAIRKFIRQDSEERLIDMCGEIADVEIMIEQIKYMFPSIQSRVDDIKIFKINRLKGRLDKLQFED
jgi:hypothetical protein